MTATPDLDLAEGQRLLDAASWTGKASDLRRWTDWAATHVRALFAAAEERDRLREALTDARARIEDAGHLAGCNGPYGYLCKCGLERDLADIDAALSEKEDT